MKIIKVWFNDGTVLTPEDGIFEEHSAYLSVKSTEDGKTFIREYPMHNIACIKKEVK